MTPGGCPLGAQPAQGTVPCGWEGQPPEAGHWLPGSNSPLHFGEGDTEGNFFLRSSKSLGWGPTTLLQEASGDLIMEQGCLTRPAPICQDCSDSWILSSKSWSTFSTAFTWPRAHRPKHRITPCRETQPGGVRVAGQGAGEDPPYTHTQVNTRARTHVHTPVYMCAHHVHRGSRGDCGRPHLPVEVAAVVRLVQQLQQ